MPPAPITLEEDLNRGMDSVLFGPSRRPDEPITAGAPFGAGPGAVRFAHETDRQFLRRVADDLAASPDAPKDVQRFAERVRRGE
jgi:hypothetical protein